MSEKTNISTESYKGVRDFYPEDMFIQNYIFNTWKSVVESFGYLEYSASVLESAELYKAKSGEEIVNEQTYTFKDRGDREVTLRPEMTPTVARLVAAKRNELTLPLRWYSIPNLFRYEKPQRGRLREHWQLNVDIFGINNSEADLEILTVAYNIMKKFGATDESFILKVNSRKLLNDFYKYFELNDEQSHKVAKIIDKKNKIPADIFEASLEEIAPTKATEMLRILSSGERFMEVIGKDNPNALEIVNIIEKMEIAGIKNVVFDQTLMRGFDYYTGVVFEVFDTHPDNNRSVFGGGRYDDLLSIFGSDKIPAFGFGAGDVTARDFLEVHNLLPAYTPSAELYIATLEEKFIENAKELAKNLREEGIKVVIDLSNKKVGEQIKVAHKQKTPYVIVIGDNEVKSDKYSLKHMDTGTENLKDISGIVEEIKKNRA